MKSTLLSLLSLLAISTSAYANPPANDQFTNAATLLTEAFGTNAEATTEANEPDHAGTVASRSVWWNYTATTSGPLEIETMGSDFNTKLAVYTGSSLNALTLVAENDDHAAGVNQSRVVFNAVAGTVYRIAVDGFGGATGLIELFALDATPPANDNFVNATNLGSVSTASVSSSNIGATPEPNEGTHAGHPADLSIWWKWTAPFTGDVVMDTDGSSVDTLLSVYTGNNLGALTLVAEDDDALGASGLSRVLFPAVAGVTYYIAVDTYHGIEGTIRLQIAEVPALPPPSNDDFTNATVLPRGIAATVNGTNDHATFEVNEPVHANVVTDATSWWSWTPYATGPVVLSTNGSGFDTVLAVYTGTALNSLALISANDDISGTNSRSSVSFTAQANTTYQIVVGGYRTAKGAITLGLAQTPNAPANDLFANRINLGNGGSATATGVNIGATFEEGEPAHAQLPATRTVWWKWTCPADEYVNLSTSGSTFDSVIGIYTGSALSELTSVATEGSSLDSLNFLAIAGTTYVIAVQGESDQFGAITLQLEPVPPPTNDLFANATVLSGPNATASGNNYDATAEIGEPAHANSTAAHSIWWNWTAPTDGLVTLNTDGSLLDTKLAVYTGTTVNALTLVMANDNEPESGHNWSLIRFRAHAGVTYRIALDGSSSSQGPFNLVLTEEALGVDNDAFADRVDLGSAATITTDGSNLGASAEPNEPSHRGLSAEESVWWKWTAPTTGWTKISTTGSNFVLRLGVYTGNTLVSLAVVPNIQSTGDLTSYNFYAAAGTTYSVAVDGVSGHEGQIKLLIGAGEQPTAPANDQFSGRTILQGPTPISFATGSSLYASAQVGEPAHGGLAAANSVWYEWTAPLTGRAVFDGSTISFPARVGIYTGSNVNALNLVTQSSSLGSTVLEFNVVAETTYQIAVDDSGTLGAGGPVTFTLDYKTPINDNFSNAINLGSTFPTTSESYNTHASSETGEPVHAGVNALTSIWWKWTAPAAGLVTIETTGSTADTLLGVYTGPAVNALSQIASNDDASGLIRTSLVTFTATQGTVYLIAVDGYEGSSGAISLSIHSGTAPPAPANDNFANAIDLGDDHPLSVTGTNEHASAELNEPAHAANPAIDSVWWKWTAPVNTTVTIDTLGSEQDTVLAVYTGTLNALTSVASNDDANGGTIQSSVTFPAVAGTTYYLAVDGYEGVTGAITLNLNVNAPANDQFAHRTSLGNVTSVVIAASNSGATTETNEPLHAGFPPSHTIWWTWTAPANIAVDLHTFGSELDTVLAVYTGNALASLALVASNDNYSPTDHNSRVVFNAIAGTTYQIAIGSRTNGDVSDLDISLSQTTIIPVPINDQFSAATDLSSAYSSNVSSTTIGATAETNEPAHAGSPAHDSVWWKWTAPFNGTITVSTTGSSIDTRLAIYTGNALSTLTAGPFNDDATAGVTTSLITHTVVAGTKYYIAVDGFAGAEGGVTLALTFTPTGTALETAYATWNGANLPTNTPAADRALPADADRDGIPNGIEFLTGQTASSQSPASPLSIRASGANLVVSYPRGSSVPAGFESIEASNNMNSWIPLNPALITRTIIPGLVGQPDTVEITVPLSLGYQYFRIRVNTTP